MLYKTFIQENFLVPNNASTKTTLLATSSSPDFTSIISNLEDTVG